MFFRFFSLLFSHIHFAIMFIHCFSHVCIHPKTFSLDHSVSYNIKHCPETYFTIPSPIYTVQQNWNTVRWIISHSYLVTNYARETCAKQRQRQNILERNTLRRKPRWHKAKCVYDFFHTVQCMFVLISKDLIRSVPTLNLYLGGCTAIERPST
jgi:Mg2+ and Co2+ transporter CorA